MSGFPVRMTPEVAYRNFVSRNAIINNEKPTDIDFAAHTDQSIRCLILRILKIDGDGRFEPAFLV